MALRTRKEYLESIRDGREVYYMGEKIKDLTKHPITRLAVEHAAQHYDWIDEALKTKNKELQNLLLVKDPKTGKPMSRFLASPKTPEDLVMRRDLIEYHSRRGPGLPFLQEIGTDALNAFTMSASAVDKDLGTDYAKRVKAFYRYIQENDLSMCGAVTDVKGDRSLRPSRQDMPDYYVRIVERRKDGIVVRGAKAHIGSSPYVNEVIVCPTRAMSKEDADYAVAFAIPPATKGVKMIAGPKGLGTSRFDFPLSSIHQSLDAIVIFDNVFVPWDRVFLCGEWQHAAAYANNFGTWHRFTAVAYKPPAAELLLGAARLIAEYNGVPDASHIRERITDLIIYVETVRAFGKAAAYECEFVDPPGIACPNQKITNAAKFYFANNFHDVVKAVQEVAGGLVVTGPSEKDFLNPATKGYIEKYLGGKKGVSTENRLKAFNLIRDLTASSFGGMDLVLAVHAEGSLAAQRLVLYREYDIERCVKYAKEVANIKE